MRGRRSLLWDAGRGAESAGLWGRRVGRLPAATPRPGPLGELLLGVETMPPRAIAAVSPRGAQWDWFGQPRRLGFGPGARLRPGLGWGGQCGLQGSLNCWRLRRLYGESEVGTSRVKERGGSGEALAGEPGVSGAQVYLLSFPPPQADTGDRLSGTVLELASRSFSRGNWSGLTWGSGEPGGRA